MKYTPANAPRSVRRKWARLAWSPAARKLRACHRSLKSAVPAPAAPAPSRSWFAPSESKSESQYGMHQGVYEENPRNQDGYYVMSRGQSIAWYPTREEAQREATQQNYHGGRHVTVEAASRPGNAHRGVARNPELLVVTPNPAKSMYYSPEEISNPKKRRTAMRRRKGRNGKLSVRIGGHRRTWKGLVKKYGVMKAKSIWRKKKKFHGGTAVCGGTRRRRKGRKGRRGSRSRWMKLVKRWGVKGAKKRYRKGRR